MQKVLTVLIDYILPIIGVVALVAILIHRFVT